MKLKKIQNVETRNKCLKFNEYFYNNWIDGVHFKPEDWNQCSDLSVLTNNWSEGFNSGFSKRFARSHPNPFTLIETLDNVVKYYKFLKHDIMIHRSNYRYTNYSSFSEEIITIQSEKETVFMNNKRAYMTALSNVQL